MKAQTEDGKTVYLYDNGTWESNLKKSRKEKPPLEAEKSNPNSCSDLIQIESKHSETIGMVMVGDETDDDYVAFKGIKTPKASFLIFICGDQIKCVTDKSYLLIDFGIGREVRFDNQAQLNCDSRFTISLEQRNSDLRYFQKYTVKKIKLVSGSSTIEKELDKKLGMEIFDKINCLLMS